MIFWQHHPSLNMLKRYPKVFLIIIEGEKSKHEEIQNICHQNDQIHKLLMISI